MRFWFILCSLVLGVNPLIGLADPDMELIEEYPTGHINWTHGLVVSKGSGFVPVEADARVLATLSDDARRQAIANVRETLARLRMDRRTCADVMAMELDTRHEVYAMASAADIVETVQLPDGGIEVTVQMLLHGGFAQLMLPEEIRQVESIKPLNGNGAYGVNDSGDASGKIAREAGDHDAFTGLIVDARGIGAQPAMVPLLYDEDGQEVYSPAFVSREYAVQYGICQYRRFVGDATQDSRVAPKPLMVKGLRTNDNVNSQVVISNADAAKLRSSSAHLNFLKQCRVIILMD